MQNALQHKYTCVCVCEKIHQFPIQTKIVPKLKWTDSFTDSAQFHSFYHHIWFLDTKILCAYLDAWLWQACGLGQTLSEADSRVRVSLKGGTQELHMFFGEAGPLPATGTARGAAAGGHGPGIIWGRGERTGSTSDRIHNTSAFHSSLQVLHRSLFVLWIRHCWVTL